MMTSAQIISIHLMDCHKLNIPGEPHPDQEMDHREWYPPESRIRLSYHSHPAPITPRTQIFIFFHGWHCICGILRVSTLLGQKFLRLDVLKRIKGTGSLYINHPSPKGRIIPLPRWHISVPRKIPSAHAFFYRRSESMWVNTWLPWQRGMLPQKVTSFLVTPRMQGEQHN